MINTKLNILLTILITIGGLSCTSQDKKDASDFFLKGNHELLSNNYAEALRLYDEAISKNPEFADAYLNKGIALMKLNRNKDAFDILTRAIEVDPTLLQANLTRAESAILLSDLNSADADLKHISKDYKDSSRYYLIHGDLLSSRGETSTAVADYDKSISLAPTNSEAFVNRGAIYYGMGKYVMAKSDFLAAIKVNPFQTEAINNLGLIATKEGNWEQALAYFDKILSRDPSNALALNNKGYVEIETGKLEQARQNIEHSIEVLPENGYALRNLGLYYLKTKDHKKAISAFEKAISFEQPVESLFGYAGLAYFANHDKNKACETWSKGKLLSDSLAIREYTSNCP